MDFDEKAGGASGYLPGGIGWYRKSFMIPASYKNQKVSLVFDGIYHKATIFLNGKEIAYHRYGYTSFET
ncbi:sugar-binding domain-containing protein, partial [Agathobacter rectalis]|uniref:sugar-binding domain-containing protein n=1 Tax=Agathobacter rectalis TaxID=39491 RepID=UPI0027D2C0D0